MSRVFHLCAIETQPFTPEFRLGAYPNNEDWLRAYPEIADKAKMHLSVKHTSLTQLQQLILRLKC